MPEGDPGVTRKQAFPAGPAVVVCENEKAAAWHVLARVLDLSHERSEPRVCLASGNTFRDFFRLAAQAVRESDVSLSSFRFTHLDEFIAFGPGRAGGMATQIQDEFLAPIGAAPQAFLPVDARGEGDVVARHRERLEAFGRLDLVLLGIGANGHVAFNEPGTSFGRGCARVVLDEVTRRANAARFPGGCCPEEALTLGPAEILASRELLLVALGAAKASAVKAMLEGPLSPACPASLVRLHPRATVILDRAAAAELEGERWPSTAPLPPLTMAAGSLAPGGPVAVVSPHPDDASLSAGGLLAGLDAGTDVHLIQMTTGARAAVPGLDPEGVAALREEEAREEARILGGRAWFLRAAGYETGAFEEEDCKRLLELLARIRPAWVVVPSRDDPHPTHALVRRIADESLRRLLLREKRPFQVWTAEGAWHLLHRSEVNMLVILDEETEDRKLAAARAHRSQMERLPFDEAARHLARLRGLLFSESALGPGGPPSPGARPVEAYHREWWRPPE